MNAQHVERVKDAVAALRQLVGGSSTTSVVGMCLLYHLQRANSLDFSGGLVSPARQVSFLLGLLLATREPEHSTSFGESDWAKAVGLLNDAFTAYQNIFWPTPDEQPSLTDKWRHTREVAMLSFLHYFNTGLLASPQQVAGRVRTYLGPFDANLREILGLATSDALTISEWISSSQQVNLDELNRILTEEAGTRHKIIESAAGEGFDVKAIRHFADRMGYREQAEALVSALGRVGSISLADIRARFPSTADAYWRLFATQRGDGPNLHYPTERSVFEFRPLIVTGENTAMCPSMNALFNAILDVGENALTQGMLREQYLLRRDQILEAEVAKCFKRLLGDQAMVFTKVYETPKAQFEHDVVAITEGAVFIIEAKARPPIEPFRDPDKAFQRLKHAFASDRGIQSAFDQASRIRRRLDAGEEVPLFDEKGTLVATLHPSKLCDRHCVCVTRDDFGPLATNLSLLLEKTPDEPYPWAINILDLQALCDSWQYLGWGVPQLRDYLRDRLRAHGKVFGTDELEYVGYFIRHGSLRSALEAQADLVQISPSYSDFFDELYQHVYHEGPPPDTKLTSPVTMDLRKSLAAGEPIMVQSVGGSNTAPKVGRNDPCPCGSGKKYKKCHGRP